MSYQGTTTVLHGRDFEALDILIDLHAISNPIILDATFGNGTMWKGCKYFPESRMDVRSLPKINHMESFENMASIKNSSIDVVVFDPPHLPTNAASPNSSKMWENRYGITDKGLGRDGDNVSGMFPLFVLQAKRVLTKNGIILTKLADIVHNHKYQWHHVDFINTCRKFGLMPCDMLIKIDPSAGKLKSSKWKNQKHLRKGHCYWIVVRNSNRCEKEVGG